MILAKRVVFVVALLVFPACSSSNTPSTGGTGGTSSGSGGTQSNTGGGGGSGGDRTCRISNCPNAPPQAETASQCQELLNSVCGVLFRGYQTCFLKPENDVCKADGTNNYGMQLTACMDQLNSFLDCVGRELADAGVI